MQSPDLSHIPVEVTDRKWMRSAKAWRVYLLLPKDSPELPIVFSGMIDSQVRVDLEGKKGLSIEIDPAMIVDVPSRAKRFWLVVEGCYEHQAAIGPHLAAMYADGHAILSVRPPMERHVPAVAATPRSEEQSSGRGDVSFRTLKGLHVLFQNPSFQKYVFEKPPQQHDPTDKDQTKAAFKRLAGVESCKDLSEQSALQFIREFNEWLQSAKEVSYGYSQ